MGQRQPILQGDLRACKGIGLETKAGRGTTAVRGSRRAFGVALLGDHRAAGRGSGRARGTRVTVSDVLSYLASGMREREILADFPQLTRDDIRACLAFAAEREHVS